MLSRFFFAIALLFALLFLGAAAVPKEVLATPTPSLSLATGMKLDGSGYFGIEPNGTVTSFDRNGAVFDSKQLTGEEFKMLTGCNMATPGMSSSADRETERCLQKHGIPNSDVSVKRNDEPFKDGCGHFCLTNDECVDLCFQLCFSPWGMLGDIEDTWGNLKRCY
ncbi:hypothetical protein V8E54_014679 [Elaphomyces granulatus]